MQFSDKNVAKYKVNSFLSFSFVPLGLPESSTAGGFRNVGFYRIYIEGTMSVFYDLFTTTTML